jgi:L-asparaginase
MRKVLIIFCGGTIIMKKDRDGALIPPVNKEESIMMLKNIEPKISEIAEIDIKFISNMDSTNMSPKEWDKILTVIETEYNNYDGFIITHGTDTMAYTASALSIAISNLGKPIILTGAQIPAGELFSDARRNLINAVKIATMDISGIYIVFDEKLIIGGRASKASESKLDAYITVNGEDAGELRVNIRLKNWVPKRKKGDIKIIKGFESNIFVHTLTPGCKPSELELLLQSNIKGFIIRAYGTGNIPYTFEPFIKKAKDKLIPVIITSQCLHGMTMMETYAVGKKFINLGAIEAYDQSLEMVSVKLMWGLKHYKYNKIKNIIEKNFVGEIDTSYKQ